MNTILIAIFVMSVATLFYVYAGYPLLVFAIARLFPKSVRQGPINPSVTIIITAYNEERDIKAKLENTLLIDYPGELLEIIVASDGSTDRTDEIVLEFGNRGVKLFRQEGRVGKTFTQNKAVERASGEILLFSDATTIYRPEVLHAIVPNFADADVGCVAGKLVYVDPSRSSVGCGAQSYWNYETFLKENESQACSLIGASGCLYAVRKSAYMPMYPEACSDFLICTVVYRQGLRSIYEPTAVCTEETNKRADKEFEMRVRVISQTFTDLWRNRDMLNPFKSGFYAVELISHKLLRYLIPFFLVLIFLSSAILAFNSIFFLVIYVLQLGFYLAAFCAWKLQSRKLRLSVFAVPLYFVLANLSSAVGFYKFLRGESYTRWEPSR